MATIDYIMVTEGEVTLLLDIGETLVRAGDLVIQRNTSHSWQVLGDQPAKLWGIMVSLVYNNPTYRNGIRGKDGSPYRHREQCRGSVLFRLR